MKISKHLHSCLLIEEGDKTILIDPGVFTYQEGALDVTNLPRLDAILITHEHPDHVHPFFLKELLSKFPQAVVRSNESVARMLSSENISAQTTGDDMIHLETITHERLWDHEPPPNSVFHVADRLTHPGDSHHFAMSKEILALPMTAPWGSTAEAVALALALKPKYIIPIHDWMWKDDVRQMMYKRLEGFFKEKGIEFKSLETNDVVEI